MKSRCITFLGLSILAISTSCARNDPKVSTSESANSHTHRISEIQHAITTISNANAFSFGVADGLADGNVRSCRMSVAINVLLSSSQPEAFLLEVFHEGTIYGKLHALTAMHAINTAEFERLAEKMSAEHEKRLDYNIGCLIGQNTIENILELIRRGRFGH